MVTTAEAAEGAAKNEGEGEGEGDGEGGEPAKKRKV